MSLTKQAVEQTATTVVPEPRTTFTIEIAVERIVAETGCSRPEAFGLVNMLHRVVKRLRKRGDGSNYYFTDNELDAYHKVMEVVIPDDRLVAPEGSAQEAIHGALLAGREIGIKHTAEYDTRGVRHCVGMLVVENA